MEINDKPTVEALASSDGPTELRAPDGRVLGHSVPTAASSKMSYPEMGMTDEELKIRADDPNVKWHTAEEVMERLRQLRKSA
jgi:hypothetical protein